MTRRRAFRRFAAAAAALAMVAAGARAKSGPSSPVEAMEGLGPVKHHPVRSERPDQLYHLLVRAPESPAAGARYPTVYLLDGGITFPLLSAYYHYLRAGEEAPELILVGISYGTDDWRAGNGRSRDYTAPAADADHWGGAAAFQDVLRKRIFPLVESTYPSDPARRIAFGQSLGGQFVLHAALKAPGLFWGHVASNPALHRNLPLFLEPAVPGSPRRVFVSSGENDDPRFREPAQAWMAHWAGQAQRPFDLEAVTLQGQTHFSAAPAAFRQGLRWIFSTP